MSDPRADALRAGYATVARVYREHVGASSPASRSIRALLDLSPAMI